MLGGVRTESQTADAPPSATSTAISAPEFPAPTTSTRLPVRGLRGATVQPLRIASSPRKRSTELIPTASSSVARLHAVSHGW